MTQGILLFAHNNDQVNYGLLAVWQAKRIQQWLSKPVTLVTDAETIVSLKHLGINVREVFDSFIISETDTTQKRRLGSEFLIFRNVDRSNAYDLSPYDETLIMDTDIAIMSDNLNIVWNSDEDLMVSKHTRDAFDRTWPEFQYLKDHGIEFYWATECYFKKSPTSELFFNTCKKIRNNYTWYSIVYGMPSSPIRNDHVWSIALHELGGEAGANWCPTIPNTLVYSIDRDNLLKLTDISAVVGGIVNQYPRVIKVEKQDLHIINKYDLIAAVKEEMGITE
jgi:hypothetical protein